MEPSSSAYEILVTIRDLARLMVEQPDDEPETHVLRRAALVTIAELSDTWLTERAAAPPNQTETTSV